MLGTPKNSNPFLTPEKRRKTTMCNLIVLINQENNESNLKVEKVSSLKTVPTPCQH